MKEWREPWKPRKKYGFQIYQKKIIIHFSDTVVLLIFVMFC